jgi:hypothetical protein
MTDPTTPLTPPTGNAAAGTASAAGPLDTPTTPLSATASEPAPAPASAEELPKRRPLFPTILWGALMLALAAFVAARELVPGGFDLVTWLLTAVVGIGLLLVAAGIAAAARRAD